MCGLVLDMAPIHDNFDESNINDNRSCLSSQKIETDKIPIESEISRGSKQGGATDNILLIEENYLGHTNLNNDEKKESQINNILCNQVECIKENPIPAYTD